MWMSLTTKTQPQSVLSALALVIALASNAAAEETEISYRHDILPLLSDRCFKCHGPDSATRHAGLRLDRAEDAYRELDSGLTAIVPSSPDESAVLERIETDDPDFAMPPSESGKTLSAEEKALIRRWIESGAVFEPHWAFVAPVRPEVPDVEHRGLVKNPIDAFVLARLEKDRVEPAPRASSERLIRRLSFDLIGLPPTLAEIDEFAADESMSNYQNAVDRLFASQHYGERMAAEWLDGAHFADSNGYQNDFARSMWPWRDWVIRAFNANMPYDQFVVEQLAGDLFPNSTQEQKIATGFCRNNRTVTEGGSIEEEWLVENVVDRAETTGAMFLGLTVGCARCHDHKFDPITQREFYELFAFFNNIAEKGYYEETRGNVAPLIKVSAPEQQEKLAEFDQSIASLKTRLTDELEKIAPHRQEWIESLAATATPAPQARATIDLQGESTARLVGTSEPLQPDGKSVPPQWKSGVFGRTAQFTGGEHLEYTQLKLPLPDAAFSCTFWIAFEGHGSILSKVDDANASRGWDIAFDSEGHLVVQLAHAAPDDLLKVNTKAPLGRDQWTHIAVAYDGSRKSTGLQVYFNGEKQELNVETDKLTNSLTTDQPFRVGMRSSSAPGHASVCDVRLFETYLNVDEVAAIVRRSLAKVLASTDVSSLDDTARRQFNELMLAFWSDPIAANAAKIQAELKQTTDERKKLDDSIPTTMVMEERAEMRPTYVLQRGVYSQPDKSEQLTPNVPQILPPLPAAAPRNRLGLARWLVDPANPLTARVAVNRIWQQFFGLGLVKTSENFGAQSEPPSHPELLDWLAVEFIESGWDTQHIQRLIVGSYVYQQSADVSPTAYEQDPENRLLARGPRHRLPAESVRDNALAVSGLLAETIGGPSVMPYQPPGLWEELAGGAFEVYQQGHGDDLYRRSLYVYRKRTVPHPSMSTFDAPSWEVCQVKRARTNTPLQALALLNDVVYVEAARKLAERMLMEAGPSPESRLTFAFRLATGRRPSANELGILSAGLQRHLDRFRKEPNAAEQFLAQGESPRAEQLDVAELAAHAAVASVILNLDESVSKN